jgi:hypothetical protein
VHDVVFRLPDETCCSPAAPGAAAWWPRWASSGAGTWFGNTSRDAFLTRVAACRRGPTSACRALIWIESS